MTPETNPDDIVRRLTKENAGLLKKVARLERNMEQLQFLSDNNSRLLQGVMLELEREKERLEQALNDLKDAQERLVLSEKMASLGALTAGIAHEIRNPLNFVNNFSQLSRELCDELAEYVAKEHPDEELHEMADDLRSNLERIHRNGARATQIVGSMLDLASPSASIHAPFDINELVDDALNIAHGSFRAEHEGTEVVIEKDLADDLAHVEVSRSDMTRVFVNLFSNAFDALLQRALEEGESFEPKIRVRTGKSGEWLELEVRDNGFGIAEEIRNKVFDPFFTTKKGTAGSGLGLSVSYDLVTGTHGGQLEVTSEPGVFTSFLVRLPMS